MPVKNAVIARNKQHQTPPEIGALFKAVKKFNSKVHTIPNKSARVSHSTQVKMVCSGGLCRVE